MRSCFVHVKIGYGDKSDIKTKSRERRQHLVSGLPGPVCYDSLCHNPGL